MRMWGIEPRLMCNRHLLGEHVEMHMFVGSLNKGISIQGYLDTGLVVLSEIRNRHEQLVKEMQSRGMNHKSPLPEIQKAVYNTNGKLDVEKNIKDLLNRCTECTKQFASWY